jgi:hypothetical protein
MKLNDCKSCYKIMGFFTSLIQWNRPEQTSKGPIVVDKQCEECKRPETYALGLCYACYSDLFKNAKEKDEVSNKEKL